MAKPYDAASKFLIEGYPADWLTLAGLPFVGVVEVIDANLSTITAEADKVFRVAEPTPWLAHVELQSSREGHLPRRLLRYNTLLDDRHDLPTRSLVVLLRPEAESLDLTGVYRRALPGGPTFLEFRYDVIRVWQQPVEAVLKGGLGTLPLALVSDVASMPLEEVVRRMGERIDQEPHPTSELLWSATGLLMGLRFPEELVKHFLRGVRMMKESSFYQMILEEGAVKGRAEGKVEEAREILMLVGGDRFGAPGPLARETIQAMTQVEEIHTMIRRAPKAASWEELLSLEQDQA